MKQILLMSMLALAGILAAPANIHAQLLPQYQTQDLDSIVAVVEDGVILESELDQAIATVKQQFQSDPSKLPPEATLRKQVLDRLILQKLQVQRAQDMGIRVTQDDINNAIGGIAQQNGLSPGQMRSALAQQGMSLGAFQQQVGEQILVEKLRQQILQQKVQVTDAEIDNLLNSPGFKAGEVHLAHITIDVPQGASADQIAKARSKADEVEQALANGMDFNAAAIRYSQAADALEGGDLGWRSLSEMPPQFADVIGGLKDGQITPPLRDPGGFHIIKLIGQRDQSTTVVTEYHARHISVKPDALMTDAQAKAKIENLRKKIVDGTAKFADVARTDSDDDSTANQGGDMGWFPADGWGQAVATQIQQLKDGDISQPFEAGGSWHIIKRLGRRQEDRTVEKRRQEARQAIENRKSEDVYSNFLRELRAQAYVDIRDGNQDTGAKQAP
ncbi:MAG: peptidylprolyl isomerase [Rhodanobacteraceae bacterium]